MLPLCVDRSQLTSLDEYKALNLPVLIQNIPQVEGWDASKDDRWSLGKLSEEFPKAKLKVRKRNVLLSVLYELHRTFATRRAFVLLLVFRYLHH